MKAAGLPKDPLRLSRRLEDPSVAGNSGSSFVMDAEWEALGDAPRLLVEEEAWSGALLCEPGRARMGEAPAAHIVHKFSHYSHKLWIQQYVSYLRLFHFVYYRVVQLYRLVI
jgi:hypothetical protein